MRTCAQAAHACHGPREVPEATYKKFDFIADPQRHMYHALMNYLDTMVRRPPPEALPPPRVL